MKLYIAGPMRGIPEFNFPAFVSAAAKLRAQGHVVFNPAERDLKAGFDPTGLQGSDDELAQHAFCLRSALGDDTAWICKEADGVYLLLGWENSTGAVAERALADALGLFVLEDEPSNFSQKFEKVRDAIKNVCTLLNPSNWEYSQN